MFCTPCEPRRPQRSSGEQVSITGSVSSPVLLTRLVVSMPHREHTRHFSVPASGRARNPFSTFRPGPLLAASPLRRALADLWRCQHAETRSVVRHVTLVPRWWADLGRRAERRAESGASAPRRVPCVALGRRCATRRQINATLPRAQVLS